MKRDPVKKSIFTNTQKIVKYDHVVSRSACSSLTEFALSCSTLPVRLSELNDSSTEYVRSLQSMLVTLVQSSFLETVIPVETRLVVFAEGETMGWHDDFSGPDLLVETIAEANRRFSATVYLNEDYTGGEFCIMDKNANVTVPVESGTVILYAAHVKHSTRPVRSGTRVTLNLSFVRNLEEYDASRS